MSRFYDALKQASRFHSAVNGNSSQEPLAAFGIEDITLSPMVPAPELEPRDASSSGTAADPWVISSEQHPRRNIAKDEHFGTTAKVAIDQKARVIPNVADPVVVEHYRRLRTKLMQQHAVKPFRSLLVTSPSPEEGKTVTVLNLALSFSMLPSFRVAVVDGDLRRGTLGQWLGLNDRPGLSNLIEGSTTLQDVVFKCDEIPLHFIVRGTSETPSAELLHSPTLSAQIQNMTQRFDLVLVDSPPVNLITDTHLLAANCDAVLLVARAFSTSCKSLEKAAQDLAPARLLGAVLNGGTRIQANHRYHGYY